MRMLLLFAMLLCPMSALAAAEEQPSVLVATQEAHQGSLPKTVTAYGTVEPLPDGATTISLMRAGQVEKLFVSLGQKVKQGDPLLLFASAPATQLAYDQAVTALNAAKKEQARTQQLLTQRLATKSQLAQADKAASDAEAALAAENQQGSNLKEQTLAAPFGGTITNIGVNSGDYTQANAALMQLAHGSGLAIGLGLPLDDIADIQVGQPVQLEALDAEKPALSGNVAFIGNILDPKSRLVKAIITVPADNSSELISGEQFRATIEIGKLNGIIVPRQSVLKDEKGAYIFQADSSKAQRVNVSIVGESGEDYVIDGQIDLKKAIVITGNYELEDGTAVRTNNAKAKP